MVVHQLAVGQERRDSRRHRPHVAAGVAAQVEHNPIYFIAVFVDKILGDLCIFPPGFGGAEKIGQLYYRDIAV